MNSNEEQKTKEEMRKKTWEEEYNLLLSFECPHCSKEDAEHSCMDCHSDIEKKICWEYDGYCAKCFDFIKNEIPKIKALKKKLGIKCQCDESNCAKCLWVDCKDDNCFIHTKGKKERLKILKGIQ